jgi:DNA-binding IclR family transcriptional regulator
MSRVPSASRTLAVLQTLARIGQPTTAATLAQKVGIPRSSIYQLLEVLEASGFVIHFAEESRWGLGVASFELGSAYLRHDPLERVARPILAKLARAAEKHLPAVAQVGILHGDETLYLLKELPTQSVSVVTEVGVRLPAHLTASGRALLALNSPAQLRAIYGSKDFVDRTGAGPKNMRELNSILKTEREQGYSFEKGHVTFGYASIAAAAKNHLQIPIAALALTFRQEHASIELVQILSQLVKTSADELSKRLGAS